MSVAETLHPPTGTGHMAHEVSPNAEGLKRDAAVERLKLFGLCSPALLLVLVTMILPVIWLFYLSFLSDEGTFSLEHYERLTASKAYSRIFMTTFNVSFLTTLILFA